MDRCQKDLAAAQVLRPAGRRRGERAPARGAHRLPARRARRAARSCAREDVGEWPLAYLNRLSDLLFVLSRWIGHQLGEQEYLWERPLEREAALRPRGAPRRAKARR